jgi:hypothetical protein
MTTTTAVYTTQLQAGLGMVEETLSLLELWEPGMNASTLSSHSLSSGRFPGMSARRLRNIVSECFAPRFLVDEARPARLLKPLLNTLDRRATLQLLFLFACRANQILHDFVLNVYWRSYAAGRSELDNEEAREFVAAATRDGLTAKPWSETTIRRVGSYLTGTCRDFGLLEAGPRMKRKILPLRIEPRVVTILAYDLHFSGDGDNQVLASENWQLFGLDRADVLSELKRQAMQGKFIVQVAGNVVRISWPCESVQELCDVIANG